MMTTTLKLYKNTFLRESLNYCLQAENDDLLSDYLQDKILEAIDNYQLQKPLMDLTIKINKSQEALFYQNNTYADVDYVSITPTKVGEDETLNGKTFYYFVIAKRWTAEHTLALELRMDTLNTFKWNEELSVSPKTIVEREHKDRFTKLDNEIETILYHDGNHLYTADDTMSPQGGDYEAYISFNNLVNSSDIYGFDEEYYRVSNLRYRIIQTSTGRTLYADDFDVDFQYSYGFTNEGDLWIEFHLVSSTDFGEVLIQLSDYDVIGYQSNIRKIDIYPEGINPTLYKQTEDLLLDKVDTSWNLLYRSGDSSLNPPEPVVCELIPDDSIKAVVQTSAFIIDTNVLTDNHIYSIYQNPQFDKSSTFFPKEAGNTEPISIVIGGTTYTLSTSWEEYPTGVGQWAYKTIYDYFAFRKVNGNIEYELSRRTFNYRKTWNEEIEITSTKVDIIASGTISDFSFPTANRVLYLDYDLTTYEQNAGAWTQSSTALLTIKNINEIDRTDSRLYKIIKLPYCPSDYSYTEGNPAELLFSGYWKADNTKYVFTLDDLNAKFKHTIISSVENPIYKNIMGQLHTSNDRNDMNESKLFHSDFYQVKFVYDSFAFIFQLEKIEALRYITLDAEYFTFNFVTTSTINSKFLFEFPNYILQYSTEDYDNILPVARNNEMTIYNNDYLNYLRTAYHYDLKAKERTISTARLGLGLGIASSITSAGVGLFGGGSAYSKFSAVTNAGTSIVSGIVNTINTIASAEEQFASKQEVMKAQSFSVSGSDDLDLMEYYASNRAKLVVYSVSERMRKALADLFYYCGYATNEQKVPNIYTRRYFNFIKCQLILDNVCYNEDVSNDLIAKYNEGVTFIHEIPRVTSHYRLPNVFTKENYEVWIDE